jgi:hypothetical protein
MNMLTLLLENQSQPHSDVAYTFIKTAGPEGNPFYNILWLAK